MGLLFISISMRLLGRHQVPVRGSTLENVQHLRVLCVLSEYESVPHCFNFGLFHLDLPTLPITSLITALNFIVTSFWDI